MSSHFARFSLSVEVLSAIHVGSGETIDPTDYYFQHFRQVSQAVVFDHARLLSQLTPQQRLEFRGRVDQLDFIRLGEWLREFAKQTPEAVRCRIPVDSQVAKSLEANFDKTARSGEIDLMTRSPGRATAFLPGSSIKGAIRTAVLAKAAGQSLRQHELKRASSELKEREFQAVALGYSIPGSTGGERQDLGSDPFRQLAVSDILVPDQQTAICQLELIKARHVKSAQTGGQIQIHREVIRGPLLGGEATLRGEIRIQQALAKKKSLQRMTPESICSACNEFYQPRLRDELQKFCSIEIVEESLSPGLKSLPSNQCLVRIGRHSHVECVTAGPGWTPNLRGGRSRTYLDGKLPLGWALLTISPWTESSGQIQSADHSNSSGAVPN